MNAPGGESTRRWRIDAPEDSDQDFTVPVKKIQVGQVWKKEGSGDSFLITKIYSEALATYAVLRKAGARTRTPIHRDEPPVRTQTLRRLFTYTQESDSF